MITEKSFLRNPSNINACITMHVIFLQSGEALSSETDPLKTHSFLLSSFIHSYNGEQYVD